MVWMKNFLLEKYRSLTIFLEKSSQRKFHEPMQPKCGKGQIFPQIQSGLSHKTVSACHSARYKSIFQKFFKTHRNVTCCVWFVATPTWWVENVKKCIFVGMSWQSNSIPFENKGLNFSQPGLNQQFCNCRASFKEVILGNVSYIGNIWDQNGVLLSSTGLPVDSVILWKVDTCIFLWPVFFTSLCSDFRAAFFR